MIVSRLSGLALPASTKWLLDDVIGKRQPELLVPLVLVVGSATLIQAVASFALSQVVGVAAQRAITERRKRVQAHGTRLPVRHFACTQAGTLISPFLKHP